MGGERLCSDGSSSCGRAGRLWRGRSPPTPSSRRRSLTASASWRRPRSPTTPPTTTPSEGVSRSSDTSKASYVVEYRSADGFAERFPQLAAELVRLPVDIIVTRGTPATLAAKEATRSIPIVMASSGDPVGTGLVASLARPGGNITGLISFATELSAKRVELVHELLPGISRVGLLANVTNPATPPQWEETKRAAAVLGFQAELFDVRNAADIGSAFDAAVASKVGAVVVAMDTVVQANRQSIVERAARHKLPTFYASREFVDIGGLISFRVSYARLYSRAAALVDKILKGASPPTSPSSSRPYSRR